jgi:hypothetical protein
MLSLWRRDPDAELLEFEVRLVRARLGLARHYIRVHGRDLPDDDSGQVCDCRPGREPDDAELDT